MNRMFEQALNFLESGQKGPAFFECRKIARQYKDNPGVLKLCGNIARQCNRHAEAVKWLQAAIRLDDRQSDYHYDLALILIEMNRLGAAISSLKKVLQINKDHIDARLKMGQIYCDSGSHENAIKQFKQAIQADPGQAISYCWLGIVYEKLNLFSKALGCLSHAVKLNPNLSEAHSQLGRIYLAKGDLLKSRDCFSRAVSANDKDWRALGNLCMVLRDLGDLKEALSAGRRAAALKPDSYQVWHNLGNVYKDLCQFKTAASHYEKAIQLNDANALTYTGLGIACQRSGEYERTIQAFKKALEYDSSDGTAISNLFNMSIMDCAWEEANHYQKRLHRHTIESLRIGRVPSETPFINLVRRNDPELNLAVARAWSQDIEIRMSGLRRSLRFVYSGDRSRKIQVGYLSNNFGNHPTSHITRRLYELHDRKRFKIICYSHGIEDKSQYRKAIRDGCDEFVDIRNLSHVEAAKRINSDGINILVDLVGYMQGERMAIAALRPAPIQIRWLGMAGTTGAGFFDYLITDNIVTPQDQSRFYTEKFAYLPYCYQINDNHPFIHRENCRRVAYNLPEDAFVFCCFNTSYKIDDNIFSVWMNILKNLPGSVIWLMANSIKQKENLKKAAQRSGIDNRRLIFSDKVPKDEHLARLSLADLALDTSRVNGAASTSDALWSGIPVLTLQGKHFASRMTSSILKAAGLHRMTTYTFNEYEERAVKLVLEADELRQMRSELRKNAAKSCLFNTEQFVSDLESKYVEIWEQFQKSRV